MGLSGLVFDRADLCVAFPLSQGMLVDRWDSADGTHCEAVLGSVFTTVEEVLDKQ